MSKKLFNSVFGFTIFLSFTVVNSVNPQSYSYPENFFNKKSLNSKIARSIVENINNGEKLKKIILDFVNNPLNKFSCKSRVWSFWEAERDMQQDVAVMPSLGFSDQDIKMTIDNSKQIGWRLVGLIDEDCS